LIPLYKLGRVKEENLFKWLLSSLLLFVVLTTSLSALDISLQGAKENFQNYSTLHIKDENKFLCQEITNNFDEVVKIVCAFSKSPAKKLKPLQNDFFKIETQIKKKTFFLIITPFKKMKLFSVVFNLSEDDSVYKANAKLSTHWMLVGYNKELPYIKTQEASDVAINFPFMLDKDKLPYVGSLDLEGNPVHIQEVQDVSDYLKIKRLYNEKDYEKCLELIDEVMLEYPKSLFNAELLYYKIRVNAKLDDRSDDVIELSKVYLREYSSDDNIAEVLSLIARAYSLSGMGGEADYFFDRLFSEHEDSPYAKWGYIYKGEMLEESGSAIKAVDYYKKALHETINIDIAATAAYRLALYYIYSGSKKEASKYAMKIIQAKPSFFVSKYKQTLEMIESFAEESEFATAAAIAQAVVNETNEQEYDEYEALQKNVGVWLAKTPKKQEALSALNEYLKKFPDGLYDAEVQVAKDSLFFDVNDANVSTKIADYNNLIETYSQDSIGKRAIYEKAKLMYANGMFSDILEFKDALLDLDNVTYPDTQTIVNDAAIGAMESALKNKECHSVLKISNEYSIKLSDEWDDGIYECAMKGADFLLAKDISSKNLKSENMQMRKKWLYRHIKVDFATGNYSDVVKASQELISLIEDKDTEYKDVYRVLFDTYNRLENADKMIESLVNVQKVFGASYKDIERYISVMAIGSDRNDDNLVLKYGNEVMKIQKKSDSYAQSPFVEFALYQAYINKNDFNTALEVIKSLDTVELSKSNRSRQKYLLGAIYEKLWRGEEAQVAYQESIDADASSAWAKLAQGAKEN